MASFNDVFRDPDTPTKSDILSLKSIILTKELHSIGCISDEEYEHFLIKTQKLVTDEYKTLCNYPKEENGDSNSV